MQDDKITPRCDCPQEGEAEQQSLADAKKNEILAKFGYKRSTPPDTGEERGLCGETRRRTCC